MSDAPGGDTASEDLEWLSLEGGESVLWSGGPDRRTLIPTLVISIPLAIILIGFVIMLGEYLRVTNTHYVVTDRALYRKSGILSRDVKRVEFEKVQNISYSQSAFGAHFGYGTVEISTAGSAGVELEFASVPEPRAVHQLISDRTARGRDDEGGDTDDVLEEILLELRAIRDSVESETGTRPSGGDRSSDPTHHLRSDE
ncbi:PH domain-containing protein [Natronobiforma cellulositropha]|uniref:PH domain-containing protein n=1 Tax=Natronobiforma cellulositropha TaxID=1679076 RepID=UPI0021D60E63|nr:PH domain-containing protein [Natronobiforma cellulositropha]